MSQKNDGKLAEKLVRDWLEQRNQHDQQFAYHRFPDSRSARNLMAAQPSDMLVAHVSHGKSTTTFLEVKSTEQKTRLPRTKVSQWGTLKKWHFAGAEVIVLVQRLHYNDWVFFHGLDLGFLLDETPPSFPFAGLKSYPTAADALEVIFS